MTPPVEKFEKRQGMGRTGSKVRQNRSLARARKFRPKRAKRRLNGSLLPSFSNRLNDGRILKYYVRKKHPFSLEKEVLKL